MLCRYGNTCRNPNCVFIHSDSPTIPCVHYKRGRCFKGAECKFLHDPAVVELAGKSPTPPISSSPISKPEPEATVEEPSSHSSLDEEEDSGASVEEIGPEKAETESQEEPILEEVYESVEEKAPSSSESEERVQPAVEPTPEPIIPPPTFQSPQEEPEEPVIDPPPVEVESPAIVPVSPPHPSSTTVVLFPSKVAKPSAVEAKAEAPKIIALPTKSPTLTKIQTTQMARQSRSMAEIKIKTLDQIKKEKEEQKQRPADPAALSPAGTPSKVTMMPRVTRAQGVKARPVEIPQEPTPVKKAKLAEEPLIDEEMKEQDPAHLDRLQQDAHMELLYEEIDDIINAETKPQEPVPPPSLQVVREEEVPTPLVEMQESVSEPPPIVFSPGALLANNEFEAGEVVEPLVPEFPQVIEPVEVAESLPPPPPLQEPPQVKEKPKPQPAAARKTVIAIPSASKPKGFGEILTLEQIIERKKLKAAEESAKAEANKSLVAAQPVPVQPTSSQALPAPPQSMASPHSALSQSLKRPRDPETAPKEAPEPQKKPKPQARPAPSLSPKILGDWEPLSTAFKSLDFSISHASEEDVTGMRALALRLSTPNGFLEVLEELEERVTELEVAQGLPPAVDSEFVVLSLEDQINWLYEHTNSL